MDRYARFARLYDALAAEPVYRAGREVAIAALGLRPGDRVLDIGCGTGLNFPLLLRGVGPTGRVVGVDRSSQMLDSAQARAHRLHATNVALVCADATALPADRLLAEACSDRGYDAVLFTYSLSVMPQWERAWHSATALLRDGGRAAVVDMQLPRGVARLGSPLARLACSLGGSDIAAHPWQALELAATDLDSWALRGGHIQVRVGTLSRPASDRTDP